MADDDAYEISVPQRKEETISMPVAPTEVDTGPLPDWAKKWKHEKETPRLSGKCAKWNQKGGWGFITRDDTQTDIFVHQRAIQRKGFRSLLEGERVEFEVSRSSEGRLEAAKVTGPDGADVVGQPAPSEREDSQRDEDAGGLGKAPPPPKERPKPYTAFVPRTVRPAGGAKPKPKPKPAVSDAAQPTAAAAPAPAAAPAEAAPSSGT